MKPFKKISFLIFVLLNTFVFAQNKTLSNNKYKIYKAKQLAKSKVSMPQKVVLLKVSSEPTEIIEATNYPKYLEAKKDIFTPKLINSYCNALPVNYTSSQEEIGMFFPSNNYKNNIFPGAIYNFSSIKNSSPIPYTLHTTRNPMYLNTDIFDSTISENTSPLITNFDYTTISNNWKNVLSRYINGVTPAEYESEIVLLESNNQMKTFLNTINSVDVSTKFDIPIPKIPVIVSVDNKVSVSNNYTNNQTDVNVQNSVVIKIKQVFYNSSVTLPASSNNKIFANVDVSTLADDLVYVSSVDYGQVFFIVVKSNFTKKEILEAIANKVTTKTELGAKVTGFPISGSVNVGTSNESKRSSEMVFSSSQTSVKVYQYGGITVNFGNTIESVLDKIANLNTKFNKDNIGAPLSYSLKFVKDNSNVFINTNTSYAVENCGVNLASRRYDVKLTLEKLDSKKVIDNDNNEDIYGNLRLTKFDINNTKKHDEFVFWEKKGETFDLESPKGVTQVYANMDTNIRKSKNIASNLSFEEISKGRFFLTGKINDKDILNPSYVCKECNGSPAQINLANYVDQINLLKPGESKKLKLDNNDFFELNFYENGDNKSSHIRSLWTVEVSVKE